MSDLFDYLELAKPMERSDVVFQNRKKPLDPYEPMWTLESALAFIRDLDVETRKVEWNTALAGGVLLKGESYKDLDIVFYPMSVNEDSPDRNDLLMTLNACGMRACKFADGKDAKPYNCEKDVEIWEDAIGRRVDIFILR